MSRSMASWLTSQTATTRASGSFPYTPMWAFPRPPSPTTATLTLSPAPRRRVVEAATAAVAKEKKVRLECSGISLFLYKKIQGHTLRPAQNHTIKAAGGVQLLPDRLHFAYIFLIVSTTSNLAIGAEVTFTRDVAPILYRHCVSCHHPNDIAPMSLITYTEVKPW